MISLSFIIPAYNVDKYIAVTLDSILNNKFDFEYEIIVVNDGSTDNTGQVVVSYVERYDHIVLINNTNHGVSYSRNCGVEHAKGKYVTFVDADDTINTTTYAHMVEEIEKNSYDFVQCNFTTIDNQGNKGYLQYCETTTEVTDIGDCYALFFSSNKLIHNACWGKVINKNRISNIRFDEKLIVSEDQKFVFELLYNAEKILLMEDVGYEYYQRENSAMHTMTIEKCRNKINVLQDFADHCSFDDALVYINYQKALALIELYSLMLKQKHEHCRVVREELKKTVAKEIYSMLGKKNKLKFFMICRINFVYKAAIKLFY